MNRWPQQLTDCVKVFVYMYGGAMVTGSSSNPQLQGNNFARKGVVYVNFNTRESVWASPNSAELDTEGESQNFSILDVEKALEWIHDNIAGRQQDTRASGEVRLITWQHSVATPTTSFLVATRQAPCRSTTTYGTTPTLG
jgi:hypothetical protein